MTKIDFQADQANHIYTLNGQKLRSNTECLERAGVIDYSRVPKFEREAALFVGKQVHAATVLYDERKDWKQKYRAFEGYVEAWGAFKKKYKFKPELREYPMFDPKSLIATTLDAFGKSSLGSCTTVQIKTGRIEPWVRLQTAFEEYCVHEFPGMPHGYLWDLRGQLYSTSQRIGVELKADGTFHEHVFNHVGFNNDIRVFFAAVTVAQWKWKYC